MEFAHWRENIHLNLNCVELIMSCRWTAVYGSELVQAALWSGGIPQSPVRMLHNNA